MKSKNILNLYIILFLLVVFAITGCNNLLNPTTQGDILELNRPYSVRDSSGAVIGSIEIQRYYDFLYGAHIDIMFRNTSFCRSQSVNCF